MFHISFYFVSYIPSTHQLFQNLPLIDSNLNTAKDNVCLGKTNLRSENTCVDNRLFLSSPFPLSLLKRKDYIFYIFWVTFITQMCHCTRCPKTNLQEVCQAD